MFIVGLTGGIASGKSTVSQMLRDLSCPVLDADQIARDVVEPGTVGWKKVRQKFGEDVFLSDGRLNRERLGEIVFSDSEKRKLLNSIVHPEIYKAMVWNLIGLFIKGEQFVILDLPLLFETKKMLPYMTFTVVVACSKDQQLERLMKRNNYSQEEAQQRINCQMPLEDKCHMASHVIDNGGDTEATRQQVAALYRQFRSCQRHWILRIGLLSMIGSLCGLIYWFLR